MAGNLKSRVIPIINNLLIPSKISQSKNICAATISNLSSQTKSIADKLQADSQINKAFLDLSFHPLKISENQFKAQYETINANRNFNPNVYEKLSEIAKVDEKFYDKRALAFLMFLQTE